MVDKKARSAYLKDKYREQAQLYYKGLLERGEEIKAGLVIIPIWENGLQLLRYTEKELVKVKESNQE